MKNKDKKVNTVDKKKAGKKAEVKKTLTKAKV